MGIESFVISPGTQVVLKVAKTLAGGDVLKKPGSVGVVIQSPPDQRGTYEVEFADGYVARAYHSELSLRRREVDLELQAPPDEDLREYICYCCQVGSVAFGLSTAASDQDLRGIYLPPARLDWSIYSLPEQLEFRDDVRDEVYWELGKFLRLALKANPNVLETLWTPVVIRSTPVSDELRTIRTAFLSKHLYKTYSGYVLSQFRQMSRAFDRGGTYKPKHAMHLLRLLYSGITAVESGEIQAVRGGELEFAEVRDRAVRLERRFQEAFERTQLPDQPDFARVNAFLISARKRMIDA